MCAIVVEAAATFLVCLALHVFVWRFRRPSSYRAWLPALVAIFLAAGPLLARGLVAARLIGVDDPAIDAASELTAVLLLHGAASAVYIIGYTLVSAFSPSIEILKVLDRAHGGIAPHDIDVPFLRHAIGGDRVRNLVADGLLEADGDAVWLSARARKLAMLALVYRRAIGLPDGAGG